VIVTSEESTSFITSSKSLNTGSKNLFSSFKSLKDLKTAGSKGLKSLGATGSESLKGSRTSGFTSFKEPISSLISGRSNDTLSFIES